MGKMAELYYRVEDFDRLLAYATRVGRVEMPGGEVYAKRLKARGGAPTVAASFLAGYFAGVAVVWDGGPELVVMGTRPSLDFFDWGRRYAPFTDAYLEGLECLELPDTRDERVLASRDQRINLPRVKDRVAAAYPDLRDWCAPGEVKLLPRSGDLRLGGRVFNANHYLRPNFKKTHVW